jgi:hypothetical protein
MTDSLQILKDLSARARREDPPRVDVSRRVILRLSGEIPVPAWPMTLVASGAAVTALVVLGITLPFIETLTDPMSAFFLMAINILP